MEDLGGVLVWGEPRDDAVGQMRTASVGAAYSLLMADHHFGFSVPNGSVLAYDELISPTAVGLDIGCGNKAVRLDVNGKELRRKLPKLMDLLARRLSFGVVASGERATDHPIFDDELWMLDPVAPLRELAQTQLGTVGGGNHFVDLFVDELDRVWCGVHFGSRGLGHRTATWFLDAARAVDSPEAPPCLLNMRSSLGEDYLQCMTLAGRYASAGRDLVCEQVAQLIGAKIVEEVHNHHNFAWRETHNDRDLWVIRKGATPAFPGQRGFVGGSMGEPSVILEGIDSEESKQALYSTVHGAGRVMSRTRAKKQLSKSELTDWMKKKRIELRGGGVDEHPKVYKRLDRVLRHHAATVKIVHTLTPLGVLMAPDSEHDPYKD